MTDKNVMEKFILMGVSGCGKTSIGEALARRIDIDFIDGDGLHPRANIDKMARGIALTDADRKPWLERVGKTLASHHGTQNSCLNTGQNSSQNRRIAIGCSALKRSYRDIIRDAAGSDVCFILLDGSRELIGGRMAARTGHFMPLALLDSQFAILERPDRDETAIIIDISNPPALILDAILQHLEAM